MPLPLEHCFLCFTSPGFIFNSMKLLVLVVLLFLFVVLLLSYITVFSLNFTSFYVLACFLQLMNFFLAGLLWFFFFFGVKSFCWFVNIYLRTSRSEFIVSVNKYLEAKNHKLSVGMRFKMRFEGDEIPERRCFTWLAVFDIWILSHYTVW